MVSTKSVSGPSKPTVDELDAQPRAMLNSSPTTPRRAQSPRSRATSQRLKQQQQLHDQSAR